MDILGKNIAFKENIKFSFNQYLTRWLVLLVTVLLDYLTTIDFVEIYGSSYEANIIIRFLIDSFGIELGVLIGKVMQIISVSVFVGLDRNLGNIFLLVVILLNAWAIIINLL